MKGMNKMEYNIIEKEFIQDYDGIKVKETRFVIVDKEGNIIDDAQGYGYKTKSGAYKAHYYKSDPIRVIIDKEIKKWKKQNSKLFYELRDELDNRLYNAFILEIEFTYKDFEDLCKEFNITKESFNNKFTMKDFYKRGF